jgi:hypothetical protein
MVAPLVESVCCTKSGYDGSLFERKKERKVFSSSTDDSLSGNKIAIIKIHGDDGAIISIQPSPDFNESQL